MVRSGELQLHVEVLSESSHEVRSEECSTVGYDIGGNTMLGEHMKKIHTGEFLSGKCSLNWNEETHLGKSVDNDQDRIELF